MQHDVVSDLVQSAAFLRREFLGRDNFKKRRNTIYVYDTDVIKASCAPWTTGPGREQGGNGYGEPISLVLPDEKTVGIDPKRRKQKAERVSKILADHGLDLAGTFPIYQFKPHFEKTTEIYGYVRNDAERDGRRTDQIAQKDRERRNIIQLSALIAAKSESGETSKVAFEAALLTEILNNSVFSSVSRTNRNIQEWDAFVELNTRSGGIFPIGYAADHVRRMSDRDDATQEEIDSLLAVADAISGFSIDTLESDEAENFDALRRFWRGSRVWFNDKKLEETNSNYASSLALLGLLNMRLHPIGWRAVFVTGSKTLVDVSYGAIDTKAQQILGDIGQNFGNRFVRHIWAYTSEALIEPYNQAKFVNWLDGLLGKWAGKSAYHTSGLTALRTQRTFKGVTVQDCREAFASWDEQTSNMVAQHNFLSVGERTNDLQEKLVSRIRKSRKENLDWGSITNLLLEDNDRANDEAFLVFSNIGVDALISAQQTSRHPPDLDFESLTKTRKIFAKLTSKSGYRSRKEFETDFAAIKEDCFAPEEDNRQFSHLRFLALGAAFASASRWSVALSQAQRAIRIIERSRERGFWPIPKKAGAKSYMSGREAYFLASVALRMISRHEDDFVASAHFLSKAEDALALDWKEETANNFDTLRFLNEKCALALSQYYFHRMKDEGDLQDERFQRIIRTLENGLEAVNFFEASEDLKKRRASTLAHVALNTIQAHAIKAFRNGKADNPKSKALHPSTLSRALAVLKELAEDSKEKNARLFKTKLMDCYGLVGSILVDGPDKIQPKKVEEVFKGWERTVVTEYDTWRYKNLRTLTDKLVASYQVQ